MKIEKVLELIGEVPDYQVFLTVDELNASAEKLAAQNPEVVDWYEVGISRAGEKINVLKIGNGARNALLFAMPHPNEPIGSMMLEFLSEKLVTDVELREEMDYTWYIIKCIDVDGTRLNEGWFKGPFSVTNYARHYYRPPGFEQVEWTFPVEYKTLKFDAPMPETQVIMKLVEELKPDFMFSLHNSGFGGVYLYISHDLKEFYPDFYQLVDSQELPLHLGEPEVPFAPVYSEAIFGELGIKEIYEFMAENTGRDPGEFLNQGAGSYDYAVRYADPLFLICEMPYFYHPAIHDTSPTEDVRRDVILKNVEVSKKLVEFLKQQYESIKDYLTLETPFKVTTETSIYEYPDHLSAQENWAKNDPSLENMATVAERFDNLYVSRFYHLLSLGTAIRMLETQIDTAGEQEGLTKVLDTLKTRFEIESSTLEEELDYKVIPIKKLVRVQLGCVFLLADRVGKL